MFSRERADRAVNFFERVLTHTKGEYAGQPFLLQDWQEKIISELFGTLNPDGTRQYRTAYIEIPKKNGKSPLAAGIALYLLTLDEEIGAEIYSAAADRDQASIVYNYAKDMVLNSALLSKRLQIVESRKRILDRQTRSFYSAVSAEVPTKHGPNIHGLIFDELHAQPNRDLWDTLSTGTAARRQPLTVAITTAGYDRTSICWELHEYARKVLEGIFDDPTFYAVIYAAGDEEDWLDEDTWYRVNPALGTFRKIEHMRSEAEKAKRVPAFQNTFRRLYLDQWTRQDARWLDLRAWDETSGEIVPERLMGVPCYAGLDLSSTIDITALVLVFPHADGFYDVLPFFWIPEENLIERSRRDGVPYDAWARDGLIETTPGNVIDYRYIVEHVEGLRDEEGYRIEEVAYDRWGATLISQELDDRGFTVVPFGQGFSSMSPPTKELLNLVLRKLLRHGGNPVLRWMADNLVVRTDPAGNIKPDKSKSREKIDGMVALIMGLDRAIRHGAEQPARYVNEETPPPPGAGIRSMVF
jgi:phage terminase large subunit-like protein